MLSPSRWFVLGMLNLCAILSIASPTFAQQTTDDFLEQGIELSEAGKFKEAVPHFTKAIQLDARNADAYCERANAYSELGEFDKAIADTNVALRLSPQDPYVLFERGRIYLNKGDADKALADLNESIRLDAKNADGYYFRGAAWELKGEFEKAIAEYQSSIRLDPQEPSAYNNIAWIQATCYNEKFRNGKLAFENASKAFQLSDGKTPRFIDTLAAAYAESGSFAQAQEWQNKAIALIPDEPTKEDFRKRLKLYEQKKPFHEEAPKAK